MKSILLASVASLALAGSAFAGGLSSTIVESEVITPTAAGTDWGGLFVTGSYGALKSDTDVDGFGLSAGYRLDLGDFVLGTEARVADFDVDRAATVELQAGAEVGAFLPYAAIGYGWAEDASEKSEFYAVGADLDLGEGLFAGARYDFVDENDGVVSARIGFSF